MYFELQPMVDDEQEVYANIKFYTEEALLRYIKEVQWCYSPGF